jgi:hypothetical protein
MAAIIGKRASQNAMKVADVREAFEGRNVCDGDNFLHGVSKKRDTDLGGMVSARSFHPNDKGVAAYAQAVTDQLNANVSARTDIALTADALALFDARVLDDPAGYLGQFDPARLESIGKSTMSQAGLYNGAALLKKEYCDDAVTGERVPFSAEGFAPGSTAEARMVSVDDRSGETREVTQSVTADENGVVTGSLNAPAVGAGATLVLTITGTNADGAMHLATATAHGADSPKCRALAEKAGVVAGPSGGTGSVGGGGLGFGS